MFTDGAGQRQEWLLVLNHKSANTAITLKQQDHDVVLYQLEKRINSLLGLKYRSAIDCEEDVTLSQTQIFDKASLGQGHKLHTIWRAILFTQQNTKVVRTTLGLLKGGTFDRYVPDKRRNWQMCIVTTRL